ncbi:MAG: T9SS type A sorting domain-containing protein, partial [Bacteroidota bacterium]
RYGVYDGVSWTVNGAQTVADIDADMVADTFLQWFSPPRQEIIFPISADSEWHDSTSLNQTIMGMTFTSSITLDSNWIVGWGTLITPCGTTDALRLHTKTITQIPGIPVDEIGEEVTFLSLDGRIGASIVIEDGRAFHRKTNIEGNTTSLFDQVTNRHFQLTSLYPNPTTGPATLTLETKESGHISVDVFNLNGQCLYEMPDTPVRTGINQLTIPAVKALPSGVYQVRLRMKNQVATRLFIIR